MNISEEAFMGCNPQTPADHSSPATGWSVLVFSRKQKLRAAIIVGIILAFLGPWTFENIFVPSRYDCDFRLNENICGLPKSGMEFYGWYYVGSIAEIFRFRSEFIEVIRLIILFLILSCPLLPIYNTTLLVLFEKYHPLKAFTIISWCLAISAGILGGIFLYPKHFWALWGLWLFIGLSMSALGLEISFLSIDRKLVQEF